MKVKSWIPVVIFLLLRCQIGNTRMCYACDPGNCTHLSKKNCTMKENTCVTLQFDNATLNQRGCLGELPCDTDFGPGIHDLRVSFCYTDLCNSAAIPTVSLVTGIATLLALWLAKLS